MTMTKRVKVKLRLDPKLDQLQGKLSAYFQADDAVQVALLKKRRSEVAVIRHLVDTENLAPLKVNFRMLAKMLGEHQS